MCFLYENRTYKIMAISSEMAKFRDRIEAILGRAFAARGVQIVDDFKRFANSIREGIAMELNGPQKPLSAFQLYRAEKFKELANKYRNKNKPIGFFNTIIAQYYKKEQNKPVRIISNIHNSVICRI